MFLIAGPPTERATGARKASSCDARMAAMVAPAPMVTSSPSD